MNITSNNTENRIIESENNNTIIDRIQDSIIVYDRDVVNITGDIVDTDSNVYNTIVILDGQNQLVETKVYEFKVPFDCYLVATDVKLSQQRTDGTIDFKLMINDTLINTLLNIQINGSYPLDKTNTIGYGIAGYKANANDIIGLQITTTEFEPLSNLIYFNITIRKV